MSKFIDFTNESGGKFLINVDHLIGIVEHRGKVMIRTVDDRGADTILDTPEEVIEKLERLDVKIF